MGSLEINGLLTDHLINYTPGIYADGYIVFAFRLVRLYVS